MPKHCPQLRNQLQAIKTQFSAYCLELEQVKNSKEYEQVRSIQKELGDNIKKLQELIMSASLEKAREIMGTDFYGPEEVANTFGFEIKKEDIPKIPFSLEDLAKAKKLGENLILRVSHDSEGNPMTMQRMSQIMDPRLVEGKEGGLLKHDYWYKNEDFYTKDSLKMEWRLVGGSFVPDVNSKKDEYGEYNYDSTDNNYIQQTRLLRDYLKSVDSLSKEEGSECSDDKLMSLADEMSVDWATGEIIDDAEYNACCRKVALELSSLLVNANHRRSAAEIIYDFSLQFNKSKDKGFLEYSYDLSRDFSAGRGLVAVGYADVSGVRVDWFSSGSQIDYVGVVSAR